MRNRDWKHEEQEEQQQPRAIGWVEVRTHSSEEEEEEDSSSVVSELETPAELATTDIWRVENDKTQTSVGHEHQAQHSDSPSTNRKKKKKKKGKKQSRAPKALSSNSHLLQPTTASINGSKKPKERPNMFENKSKTIKEEGDAQERAKSRVRQWKQREDDEKNHVHEEKRLSRARNKSISSQQEQVQQREQRQQQRATRTRRMEGREQEEEEEEEDEERHWRPARRKSNLTAEEGRARARARVRLRTLRRKALAAARKRKEALRMANVSATTPTITEDLGGIALAHTSSTLQRTGVRSAAQAMGGGGGVAPRGHSHCGSPGSKTASTVPLEEYEDEDDHFDYNDFRRRRCTIHFILQSLDMDVESCRSYLLSEDGGDESSVAGAGGSTKRSVTVPKPPKLLLYEKYGDTASNRHAAEVLETREPPGDDASVSSLSTISTKRSITVPQPPKFLLDIKYGEKVATPVSMSTSFDQTDEEIFVASLRSNNPEEDSTWYKGRITVPVSPKFHRTKSKRKLPKSTEEKETEMMEHYQKHPFKARPMPRKVKKKKRKVKQEEGKVRKLTVPKSPNFHTSSVKNQRKRVSKSSPELDESERQKQFHALPMPDFSPSTTASPRKTSSPSSVRRKKMNRSPTTAKRMGTVTPPTEADTPS